MNKFEQQDFDGESLGEGHGSSHVGRSTVVKITEDRSRFELSTNNPDTIALWEKMRGEWIRVELPPIPAKTVHRCGCTTVWRVMEYEVARFKPEKKGEEQVVCAHQIDIDP